MAGKNPEQPNPEDRAEEEIKEKGYVYLPEEMEEKLKRAIMAEEIVEELAKAAESEKLDIAAQRMEDLEKQARELNEGDTWADKDVEELKREAERRKKKRRSSE